MRICACFLPVFPIKMSLCACVYNIRYARDDWFGNMSDFGFSQRALGMFRWEGRSVGDRVGH